MRDAITDELLDAAERMEKVIHEIRRETDLHELGLYSLKNNITASFLATVSVSCRGPG